MAKITSDELLLILNVEATGAQKEINQLKISGAGLQKEMKETSSALKQTEKDLQKLQKAGKASGEQYTELTARANQLRQKQSELSTSLQKNADDQKRLVDSLKLSEMTMNQLRERAQQLKKQMDATQPNTDAWKNLNGKLGEVNAQMQKNQSMGKSMSDVFSGMPGIIGTATRSVKGIGQAIKVAFSTGPMIILTAAIAAITVAFEALKAMIAGSDSAATQWAATMAAGKAILDSMKRTLAEVGVMLKAVFAGNTKEMKEAAQNMKDLKNSMIDAAKSAYEAKIMQDRFNDTIARQNDLMKVNRAEIADLQTVVRDQNRTLAEREAAMKRIEQLQKENYDSQRKEILMNFQVWMKSHKQLNQEFGKSAPEAVKQLNGLLMVLKDGGELTYEQMRTLANAANDITTLTDRATEEEKAEFRKFFSDLSDLQQQYYSTTKRDRAQNAALIREERKREADEAAAAEKERAQREADEAKERAAREKSERDERLSNLKQTLQEELLVISKLYADQLITKEQFDEQRLDSERKYYEAMLAEAKQAGTSTIEIEQRLTDMRIADNERAKKATDELNKKLSEQKDLISQIAEVAHDTMSGMADGLGKELMQAVNKTTEGIGKMIAVFEDENANISERAKTAVDAIGSSLMASTKAVSDYLTTIYEMQANDIEAAKNRELAAVGDNAEAKERIEREYSEKRLELQKKEADANAAVQSAQMWISTAVGVVNAWSSAMQLPFPANVAVGAALTTALLTTAGVEQAAIIKQRNAIKSQTLDSATAASSASSAKTTTTNISLKDEYSGNGASSSTPTTGFADGGYTGAGGRLEPAGIVHRGEYVVAQPELKQPAIASMVSGIERARQKRINGSRHSAQSTDGYAEGGIVGTASQSLADSIVEALRRNPIRAEVNYQQFEHAEQTMKRVRTL